MCIYIHIYKERGTYIERDIHTHYWSAGLLVCWSAGLLVCCNVVPNPFSCLSALLLLLPLLLISCLPMASAAWPQNAILGHACQLTPGFERPRPGQGQPPWSSQLIQQKPTDDDDDDDETETEGHSHEPTQKQQQKQQPPHEHSAKHTSTQRVCRPRCNTKGQMI